MATNPLVPQGTLNRVRCSIVVPSFTNLNITSAYMGKSMATITFDEAAWVDQIQTATGVVTSPEPYVMATINVGILRTQSLAQSWITQATNTGVIGDVIIHSDTASFSAISLADVVIKSFDPGSYDGIDPVSKLVLRGTFYINNNLWNL